MCPTHSVHFRRRKHLLLSASYFPTLTSRVSKGGYHAPFRKHFPSPWDSAPPICMRPPRGQEVESKEEAGKRKREKRACFTAAGPTSHCFSRKSSPSLSSFFHGNASKTMAAPPPAACILTARRRRVKPRWIISGFGWQKGMNLLARYSFLEILHSSLQFFVAIHPIARGFQ